MIALTLSPSYEINVRFHELNGAYKSSLNFFALSPRILVEFDCYRTSLSSVCVVKNLNMKFDVNKISFMRAGLGR